MKKFKNALTVILSLILACSFALAAAADVIWEPSGNSFYNKHSEECTSLVRSFTASEDTALYKAPGDKLRSDKIKAGETVASSFVWKDSEGSEWGYVRNDNAQGWVKLSVLTVVYDYISFAEEHKSEIKSCDEKVKVNSTDALYYYPGSAAIPGVSADVTGEEDNTIFVTMKYTAPDGVVWCFCPYLRGIKNIWFVDASANASGTALLGAQSTTSAADSTTGSTQTNATTVPSSPTANPTTGEPATEVNPIGKSTDVRTVALVLVIALALATAILIPIIMKRKK